MKRKVTGKGLWLLLLAGMIIPVCVNGKELALYRFDFGPQKAPVWPGFTAVAEETIYTKEAGYGLQQKGGSFFNRDLPDALAGDGYSGGVPFKMDLPDGEYLIYLLAADNLENKWWYTRQAWPLNKVTINGQTTGNSEIKPVLSDYLKEYYRFMDPGIRYSRGESIYRYEKPLFRWITRTVNVTGGGLILSYAGNLCALIIYPGDKKVEAGEDTAVLDLARQKFFEDKYNKLLPAQEEQAGPKILPEPARKEMNTRGYIGFSRNHMDDVFPSTLPVESELTKEIFIFGTPGQVIPFTICLRAVKDMGTVSAYVSELSGPAQNSISRNCIEINRVEYLERPSDSGYYLIPRFLTPFNKVELPPDITRQMWFILRVPEKAKTGNYSGKITFTPARGKNLDFALNVNVIPLNLPEISDVATGLFYYRPRWLLWNQNVFWDYVEKQFQSMKDHGLTNVGLDSFPPVSYRDGQMIMDTGDTTEYAQYMKIYARVGFSSRRMELYGATGMLDTIPLPPGIDKNTSAHFELVAKTANMLDQAATEKGWPKPVFDVADEPGTGNYMEQTKNLLQPFGKYPNLLTTFTFNAPSALEALPLVKIATLNNGVLINDDTLEKVRKSGAELWLYNILRPIRFAYGFYPARIGAKGITDWFATYPTFYPGHPWTYHNYIIYQGPDGPVNTLDYEEIREGITDFRYLRCLQNLLELAKKSTDPRVIALGKDSEIKLNKLMDMINPSFEYYVKELGEFWPGKTYDKLRWKLAELALELQKSLNQGESSEKKEAAPNADRSQSAVWWNKNFSYRLPVSVDSGPFPHDNYLIKAEIDFTGLLRQLGIKERLDENSIRVIEYESWGKVRKEVPCQFVESSAPNDNAAGRLCWIVAGQMEPFEPRNYFVYFDAAGKTPKIKPNYPPVPGAEYDISGNLLKNPGFETPDPENTMRAEGWKSTNKENDDLCTRTSETAHSGKFCAKVIMSIGGKYGFESGLIPIKPNTSYLFSSWVKVPQNKGGWPDYIDVRVYDKFLHPIPGAFSDSRGTHDWIQRSVRIETGSTGTYISVFGGPAYCQETTAYYDDMELKEISRIQPAAIYVGVPVRYTASQ